MAGNQTYKINLNGNDVSVTVDPSTPLLWVIRDELGFTGTKFGCGLSQCGACTVHLDGQAVRSCSLPISTIAKQKVTTIEGLNDKVTKVVQDSWVKHNTPQCGYCQSGQVMAAVAFLRKNPKPSDAEINEAMSGNLCRCASYVRIRRAIKDAATRLA
ncbi:MAG: (2Fe-2S)-binding protein [Oligoflexales bacterium]